MAYAVSPVGTVRNARSDPTNTDHWGDVVSTIVVDERFGDDCLVGLSDFSHVEVLFLFDQALERPEYRAACCGRAVKPTCPRLVCSPLEGHADRTGSASRRAPSSLPFAGSCRSGASTPSTVRPSWTSNR